jgi:hypothetical protein
MRVQGFAPFFSLALPQLLQSLPEMTIRDPSEYAVGWFTSSLINAGLAQAKGRSGLNWWIASLLFGPICTFLIVLWEAKNDE